MTVIDVEHVHKEYGGTVAVDDVSFSVEEAEISSSPPTTPTATWFRRSRPTPPGLLTPEAP